MKSVTGGLTSLELLSRGLVFWIDTSCASRTAQLESIKNLLFQPVQLFLSKRKCDVPTFSVRVLDGINDSLLQVLYQRLK
jgi:hypothetical protein